MSVKRIDAHKMMKRFYKPIPLIHSILINCNRVLEVHEKKKDGIVLMRAAGTAPRCMSSSSFYAPLYRTRY